ncbi:Alpha-D-glucose 1-phosphate phosphatase YihX [Defluviimonas aquaemixtae]|uniref:Alpha-D-glucose 1-phosphate phosphatase YihX n=1 Tax=Albidovulum aquaemixtae TaxID=1542388 RepID=A0A2R8B228_9RHOB|nr:HAD family phosphatase [Defluviimonas aquaemixtae]SPH16696.1 Alpha-D-glucose 1-phosphate phosphatase YihX [Defluviimonas aquaemixtae]
MARPEAVIFDIGNVLIEWQPERFYDRVMGVAERMRMFSEIDLHGMNEAIDRGAPFRETIYALAQRHPEWEDKIRLWYHNWIEMASPEIPHSVRLFRALRKRGVPVFALTNFGDETFAHAEPSYPFLAEFDRAYVSGRLQVTKPDPRIYEIVEADCGVTPEGLLFTDDRADNITAAKARGWQVHHFDGPDGLAARLVSEGLLDEGEAA